MTHYQRTELGLSRLQWGAAAVGAIALVALAALGMAGSAETFFHSYLFAYLFWLGLALGSMAVVMLQHLVGGTWGLVVRRPLERAALLIIPMALLFLPIMLFGMHDLYEWTHADVVAADPLLQRKTFYLDTVFFIGRAIFYFVVWIALAFFLNKLSAAQDNAFSARRQRRLRDISRAGLLLYVLTMTFASFDWAMSLEPHWFSTIYGMIFIVGQGLSSMAFVIVVVVLILARRQPGASIITTNVVHDLGNLLLAFTMLWAYVNFSQFLIIWSGNLPEEVTFYYYRFQNGWGWIPIVLVVFHFLVPFLLLIWRQTKRTPTMLLAVAGTILAMRLLDLFWHVKPALHLHGYDGFTFGLMDLLAPIAFGGLWIAGFIWLLGRRPLLPVHDPRLEDIAHHDH